MAVQRTDHTLKRTALGVVSSSGLVLEGDVAPRTVEGACRLLWTLAHDEGSCHETLLRDTDTLAAWQDAGSCYVMSLRDGHPRGAAGRG